MEELLFLSPVVQKSRSDFNSSSVALTLPYWYLSVSFRDASEEMYRQEGACAVQCDVGNESVVSVYCSNLFSFADHRGEQHEQSEVEILVSTDFVFQLPFWKK